MDSELREIPVIVPTRLDAPKVAQFGSQKILLVPGKNEKGKDAIRFFNADGSKDSTQTESDEEITIGRGEDNTVDLNEPSVSRRHAKIIHRGDGYWIEDSGSKNGTSLDLVETCQKGDSEIPSNKWRLLPNGSIQTTVDFSETHTTIQNRGGVAILEIYDDKRGNKAVPLRRNAPITIGRWGEGISNDIGLIGDDISKHHATLIVTDAGILIRDNDSKNGTRVHLPEDDEPPTAAATNLRFMRDHLGFLTSESQGGNAGEFRGNDGQIYAAAGLNFYVNRATGELVIFANFQDHPELNENPDLVVCGFKVATDKKNTIFDIYNTELLSEDALAVLKSTTKEWNTRK